MKICKFVKRAAAILMAVVTMVSTIPETKALAATGDAGVITFYPTYDSNGNEIKYNSSAKINGRTAGGKGESRYRIEVDGDAAFCIEPGETLNSGDTLKEGSSDVWKALSSDKKKAIKLTLLYGYQGNKKNLSGSDDEKYVATQTIIWEFVAGSRDTTSYKRADKTVYNIQFGSNYANKGTEAVYDEIVELLKSHDTIPSFMSEDKDEVLKDMKYKDGQYIVTLTDKKKVLSDFTFTSESDDVKVSKSGNTLSITSKEALEDTVRIKAVKKNVPTVRESAKLLAYGSNQLQDVVTGVENVSDVKAFVNVQTKTGNLALKKVSEDGVIEGITFTIQGEDYNNTVTTGKDGSITLQDLVPGDYTITEAQYDRYVPQQSKTVTVVGGKTATVTFSNILKKFYVNATKKDVEKISPQGDASLAGAVYGIYKGGELVDTYTTDSMGKFTTANYVCGDDWTIREISPSEGYLLDTTVYSVGKLDKSYKIQYNPIPIDVHESVVKGKVSIIKHTDNGDTQIETPEEGAVFEVYLKSAGSFQNAKETERDTLVCDKKGYAETKLMPYGVYTVHQVSGWKGRELVADFDVFVSKNGETYPYIINNKEFSAYIKIVKKDAETGKAIPYKDAGFQIYDPDGKLVTMQFTYPKVTKMVMLYHFS